MTASESGTIVPYASLVLEFTVAVYVLHTYLDLRQYRVKNTPAVSDSVSSEDL